MSQNRNVTFAPKSVLVTGGAGFIGSNYLHWMIDRYPDTHFINLDALTYAGNLANLEALSDRENYQFVRGNISDVDTVRDIFMRHGCETVVHFAAESHVDRSIEDPLSFVRSNVLGTATLLEVARSTWSESNQMQQARFHHISTDEVFGSLGDSGQFRENTPYDPRSPYAASKASSDHFVRAFAKTYGMPVIISNCSNNYGPFQFPEKLVPLVITNAAANDNIPVYGTGDNVRDWLYVDDHCQALELVLTSGIPGRTYLIGGRNEVSNLQLVEQIVDVVDFVLERTPGTGRALITFVEDRPGHDFRYAVDTARIEADLGWKPEHSLAEGMKKTVNWYLSNADWLSEVKDASYMQYYEIMYGDRLRNRT